MLPYSIRGLEAQRNSVETQQSGHIPTSEVEVKVMIDSNKGSTIDKGWFVKLVPEPKKILSPLPKFLAFFLT